MILIPFTNIYILLLKYKEVPKGHQWKSVTKWKAICSYCGQSISMTGYSWHPSSPMPCDEYIIFKKMDEALE